MKPNFMQECYVKFVTPEILKLEDEIYTKIRLELVKRENDAFEKILRVYIDHPINGDITKEKIKISGVVGIIRAKQLLLPEFEESDNGLTYTLRSNFLGVAQNNTLIQSDGARIPLDAIPCEWYEERFVFE